MPDRYLLYLRQSLTRDTPEESLSLAFQERALRELATRRGALVLEPPIVDPDEKGWDPNRPGIEELVRRVQRQQPDAVAVYAVSRFARDNWLQEGIWRRLQQLRPGLRFESATEPHANDELVRGILGVVSQAERKRMGRFLASSFAERAHRGLPHGKTPYGYAKDADGRFVIDEDAAEWVRAIADKYESGWSLWRIARWLNESRPGGRSWEPNIVRNTLASYAMVGAIRCGDAVVWDTHEPIIDRAQWDRIQTQLVERRRIRTKNAESWLEGLIDCGCGAPLHLIANVSGRTNYAQFRCAASPTFETFQRARAFDVCTHSPRSIVQHKAEPAAIDTLLHDLTTLLPPDVVSDRALARYRALTQSSASTIAKLERQRSKLTGERDRLLTVYRRGSLDVDRWETDDRALSERLALIDRELAAYGSAPEPATFTATHDALAGLAVILSADPSYCRRVLLETGARVQLRSRGVVRIVWPEHLAPFVADAM